MSDRTTDAVADSGSKPAAEDRLIRTLLSVLPVEKIVSPLSIAAAGILFLLGLQHLVGLRIEKCTISHNGFSCNIAQLETELDKKNNELGKQIIDTNSAVTELARRISKLEGVAPATSAASASLVDPNVPSDALTEFLQPLARQHAGGPVQSGVIFLGNNRDDGSASNLRDSAGRTLKITDLASGRTYVTDANLTLREFMPPDTENYYRTVPSTGVLRKGTAVRLTGTPVFQVIDRNGLKQAWGWVEVVR